MDMVNKRLHTRILLPLAAGLLIGGCVSSDISDLEQWKAEVLARPGGRIEPVPEFKPYEAYEYQSADLGLRNPFTPFYRQAVAASGAPADPNAGLTQEQINEINNRNREELESYELDSLQMVGTMENEANNWGIVLDPDGNVTRVRVGNYMGRNVGKIVNIFPDRIELREIVRNSQGRWEERQAAIALVELQ